MTNSETTGDQPVGMGAVDEQAVEYETNVPQEQVQENATWDTGSDKDLPSADKKEYWQQVSDENAEDGAGMGTGGAGQG